MKKSLFVLAIFVCIFNFENANAEKKSNLGTQSVINLKILSNPGEKMFGFGTDGILYNEGTRMKFMFYTDRSGKDSRINYLFYDTKIYGKNIVKFKSAGFDLVSGFSFSQIDLEAKFLAGTLSSCKYGKEKGRTWTNLKNGSSLNVGLSFEKIFSGIKSKNAYLYVDLLTNFKSGYQCSITAVQNFSSTLFSGIGVEYNLYQKSQKAYAFFGDYLGYSKNCRKSCKLSIYTLDGELEIFSTFSMTRGCAQSNVYSLGLSYNLHNLMKR